MELLYLAGKNVKWFGSCGKQYVGYSEKLNIESPYSNSKRIEGIESEVSKTCLYTYVHSSIIHDSQEVETIHMSSDRGMDKQNVAYTHNGLLLNFP